MWFKILFAALALMAGFAIPFQAGTNQNLMKWTGIGPALIVNTSVVLVGTILLYLALGGKGQFFPPGARWTLYFGGAFGFFIIALSVFVFPKLGATYTIALMVCGQCIAAMIIDHYGMLGLERSPVNFQKILGIGLVGAGIVVFRVRWN